MCLVTLNKEIDNKLTVVNLPKVSLYFSYETLVAFSVNCLKREHLFLNKDIIDYSVMTSKNLNKLNSNLNTIILSTKLLPINKTNDQFNKILKTIFNP